MEVCMTISTRLSEYLNKRNISFDSIEHPHSTSSISSAAFAQVPIDHMAKAVILTDHEDRRLMAIIPADRKVNLATLNEKMFASFRLAKEQQVYQLFNDCEHGAIPPIAEAFNMRAVCDMRLDKLDAVYLEAGDHQHLLRISHQDFEKIVDKCQHLNISKDILH